MIPDTKPNGLRFDAKQVKNTLLKETQFIKNLFSILPIPTSALQGQDNEDEQESKPPKLNGIHGKTRNKNERKTEKDPKKILKNLEKQKTKLAELEAKGEKEKATELKEKQAWKNALAKSEGEKVKDDPYLLKKSIKKREQVRNSSKKKWEVRKEGVKKAQDTRQAKRQENLNKRKKDKKVKTMKKAVKKGKIIPGF
ncbi:Surfeit 6 [Carabus blaptoides fortunei]